jgi:lipid II isoglutaminyl synthase (glutamine-hydrolysing)
MKKKLTVGYLYPEYMNIYGDTGNIITLINRGKLREINIEIKKITINSTLNKNEIDIYFFGGGQDLQQEYIAKDLQRFKETITADISGGAVALTICGGYQLFGNFYRPFNKEDLIGVSIFPVETHASNVRMIGNCVIKINQTLHEEMNTIYASSREIPTTLVGFENHSGQTRLTSEVSVLGAPTYGYGNNEDKKTEGCHVHNAFGTYLHGSLLPKNPHFADYLIYKALEYRYKDQIKLSVLDDSLEYQAHNFIVNRYKNRIGEND